MQSKLNEILELCIEKSNDNVFYTFAYSSKTKCLMIDKDYIYTYNLMFSEARKYKCLFKYDEIYLALEYMQNE